MESVAPMRDRPQLEALYDRPPAASGFRWVDGRLKNRVLALPSPAACSDETTEIVARTARRSRSAGRITGLAVGDLRKAFHLSLHVRLYQKPLWFAKES